MKSSAGLYWGITPNHWEDWFTIAKNLKEAQDFFAYSEGFDLLSVRAEFICEVPLCFYKKEANWPTHAQLRDLGFVFLQEDTPRVVLWNGRKFQEGGSGVSIVIDEFISNTTGVYLINIRNTNKYKIGKTNNSKKRLKSFQTGNSFDFSLIDFKQTNEPFKLEKYLHSTFKQSSTGGEWFTFDSHTLTTVIIAMRNYSQ